MRIGKYRKWAEGTEPEWTEKNRKDREEVGSLIRERWRRFVLILYDRFASSRFFAANRRFASSTFCAVVELEDACLAGNTEGVKSTLIGVWRLCWSLVISDDNAKMAEGSF